MVEIHFCLPQFRNQHFGGSANIANLQQENHFCLPQFRHKHFFFWEVTILQTYSEKRTFVYHNSGINSFVGASTLLGAANVAKCNHTFVYHNSGIYTFVGLPMLQSYSDRYLFLCTTISLYQHCWKLPFLKGRQYYLRFWLLSLEAAAACSNQALKMAVMG